MDKVTRRFLVTSIGAASVVPGTTLLAAAVNDFSVGNTGEVPPSAADRLSDPVETTYFFFNAAEARFIEAACERLIPADESVVGALGAGVRTYLNKQLGGAWGPESGCIAVVRGLLERHRRATSCHSPPPGSSTRTTQATAE
jgi:gluconate 2-dehydrogenase gamma chain